MEPGGEQSFCFSSCYRFPSIEERLELQFSASWNHVKPDFSNHLNHCQRNLSSHNSDIGPEHCTSSYNIDSATPFVAIFSCFQFISCIKRSINSEKLEGKVVLITGASSGIGEYLAYEYARRGACLALAARRAERLQAVTVRALELGSPDVIVISTDISKVEDCERFINEAVNHFGRLDHLVNNAGIVQIDMLEDCKQISDPETLMNTNFWGSVYATHVAIPHLRKSKGRIVGISSIAGWCSAPRMSFYCASKAALTSFYEAPSAEFGADIGITIVTPGIVKSEMSQGDAASKTKIDLIPAESTERCAKAIVDSACRGDRYLIEPSWARVTFLLKVLCPEVMEWCFHWVLVAKKSKKRN